MANGLLTAFETSDEDVMYAAGHVGIEMSPDEAGAYLRGLSKDDLADVAKAALKCVELDDQTEAAQQKIAEFLVRDGHSPSPKM
jgi:hypothetical protein